MKSNKLVNFITELAENPALLSQFKANPKAVLAKARLSTKDWEQLGLLPDGLVGSVVYSVEIDVEEGPLAKRPVFDITYDSPVTQLKDIPVKVVEGEDGPYPGYLNAEINDSNGVVSMDVNFEQNSENKEIIVKRNCDFATTFADGKGETTIKKTEAIMFVEGREYPADICGKIDFESGVNLILQCYPEKDPSWCEETSSR